MIVNDSAVQIRQRAERSNAVAPIGATDLSVGDGDIVHRHALQAQLRGHCVEAARLDLPLRPLQEWLKIKNPAAPAVRCEAEEVWS
jgi:hypothetical protein